MAVSLSQRLLAVLQFTRCALVFTAISNAWAAMLLRAADRAGPGGDVWGTLDRDALIWMTLCSIGLYGFGMSLNDVIDRRRDATLAADRPLPSGRLPVHAGKAICMLLLSLALIGGAQLAHAQDDGRIGRMSLLLMLGTTTLIVFYDLAGKYLISLGLITLGMIRFFHATIADPTLSMPWHPLLLMNHVAILSTVAYTWEQKRPALTKRHLAVVLGGIASVNAALIALLAYRRRAGRRVRVEQSRDRQRPDLAWHCGCRLRHRRSDRSLAASRLRGAGKVLMLVGLLWLIVYDAAFVAGQIGWLGAIPLLVLLPVAWAAVKVVRAWSAIVGLSGKPNYLRAE